MQGHIAGTDTPVEKQTNIYSTWCSFVFPFFHLVINSRINVSLCICRAELSPAMLCLVMRKNSLWFMAKNQTFAAKHALSGHQKWTESGFY